jgi:predicted O-methyltransferase YrrM
MFRAITSDMAGRFFTLPDNWMALVRPESYTNRPIKYLEIGAHCGVNVICVAASYAAHHESELYAVDPWEDYDDYPEYKQLQQSNYEAYKTNIGKFAGLETKIRERKGYSHEVIPTFPNEYFDIIYIDGNHEPEYVVEDGVLGFRKLKKGGIMIFDDYNYLGLDCTKRGVDAFLTAYRDRIKYLGFYGGQIFLQKLEETK